MSDREAFLAGDRPEDVFMYFADDAVSGIDALADHGERVADGVVLVVEGDSGRSAFQNATDMDPMAFAKQAMANDGEIDADATGGVCPDSDEEGPHDARFVFAFAEEQNEEVEGLYNEGDVIHAYVQCTCGTAYSEKWLAGEK
ncbi:hypothetical protein C475_15158 [Halosimplex carlsbadense 2-9-1]|uniref:Uncharacterized protein n=1 Tax=Halosimplex carlsbadense 2-9-1 TaxID=797114 RepID=M0CK59_9EURY|nr:DUF5807 family protein [Halosimplex carlsbadense]ELZ23621.1 hypothetical protein C475_15158 [Halosimplex carlsbadense 2-9-1]